MINQSRPNTNTPQTELNIGGGFNLLIGGVYKLIVGALGNTGITNSTKVVPYVTWGNNTTTWDIETRTWDEMGAIMSNTNKQSSSISNISKPV